MKMIIVISLALLISMKGNSQHQIDSLGHEAFRLYRNLISSLDSLDVDLELVKNYETVFGGNVDYIPDSTIQLQSIFNSWVRFSPGFVIIYLPHMDGLNPPYNKDVYYVYNIGTDLWETIPGLIYKPDAIAQSLLICGLIDLDFVAYELR